MHAHTNSLAVALELNMICCTLDPSLLYILMSTTILLLPLQSTLHWSFCIPQTNSDPLELWGISFMIVVNINSKVDLTRDWPDRPRILVSWVSVYNWVMWNCSLCGSHNLTTSSCVKRITWRIPLSQTNWTESKERIVKVKESKFILNKGVDLYY